MELECMSGTGAFLILSQDGCEVENQTGGYSCNHPSEKVSEIITIKIPNELETYFLGPIYSGWCSVENGGLSAESIVFIERLIPNFRVDQTKLHKSEEAWIYGFTGYMSCNERPCVLTWLNSD